MTSSVTRCTVIPPYILEALAASGDPRLEASAQLTLVRDAERRRHRSSPTAAPPRLDLADLERRPAEAEQERTARRTVFDAQGRTRLPGVSVRSEGQAPTGDPATDEAYDGLGLTHGLFLEVYGRDSLDARGLPLLATVHYGQRYDNAFWDGDQMVFGDGDGVIFGRFTASLDVIAHELAHGVTQYTSGLAYRGQPGALNEHISDVFGVLVVQHSRGQTAAEADWLIGADLLLPGVQGKALRSMIEPGTAYDDPRLGRDPQPAHMDDFVVTTADYGGVHINSGIPSRAFVLAALELGGYAWERAGQIWFDTITADIAADCDFATFAALTAAAAERRFGSGSPEHRAVLHAWAAVGVMQQQPDAGDGEDGQPGGESDDQRPDGQVPEGDLSEAEVLVQRTGGLAGIVKENRVRLDELDDEDARAWKRLLTGPELRAAARAEPAPGADRFWYRVCCDEPEVDVEVPEPALAEPTLDLLERTLDAAD